MAIFNALTKHCKHEFLGYDFNVDLFNKADSIDKFLWDGQHAIQWKIRSTEIIEKYKKHLDEFINELLKKKVNIFAFSINAYSKTLAFFVAKKIKFSAPDSAIIFGGPECFPAYDGLKIMENEFIDAVCTGEGDLVWPELLKFFSKYNNLCINIPGIVYRGKEGVIVDGGIPDVISNLNDIPLADYSDLKLSEYKNLQLSTMTSRGCINTCAFCSERPNFRKYRYRTSQNVYDELIDHINVIQRHRPLINKFLKQICSIYKKGGSSNHQNASQDQKYSFISHGRDRGGYHSFINFHLQISKIRYFLDFMLPKKLISGIVPFINFNDSLINGMPEELEQLCDKIINNQIMFHWAGMALIRKEMTISLLKKMKAAGCIHLAWGLESGSQKVLELMNKRFYSIDLATSVIEDTYRAGINQSISLITGFPGETEEMFQETLAFLNKYMKYFNKISVQPMMVVRNSLVFEKHKQYGIDYTNSQDALKWSSIDGTNNYEMRLKRVEILKSLLNDKLITIDK